MNKQPKSQDQQQDQQQQRQPSAQPQDQQGGTAQSQQHGAPPDFDGLKDKKPEELTPEELRWMADTMPGEGPGD